MQQQPTTQLLKIYSHPRSGTHFLEAFIGRNFYKHLTLQTYDVEWGHWSNRLVKSSGNPYGLLFGSHRFPSAYTYISCNPMIYIIRDGRAVAYSVWKSQNFLHRDNHEMSFSDFLRSKLDWHGTPASRAEENYSIAEHWEAHIIAWEEAEKANKNILLVSYESLKDHPYESYLKIREKFFPSSAKLSRWEVDPIRERVGILPNSATKNAWQAAMTREDFLYFYSKLRHQHVRSYLYD